MTPLSPHTFILCTGAAEPDLIYGAIESLAREICRRRDRLPGRPDLTFVHGQAWRGEGFAGGACVVVRVADGALGGRGSLVGYAFLTGMNRAVERLRRACAEQALVVRRAA
jgi:hypothetical protein